MTDSHNVDTEVDEELVKAAHSALVHTANNPGDEDERDPSTVQAMPIVLDIPKHDRPPRHDLLAAAGSAVAQVCLDPRAAESGPWHLRLSKWYTAKIRKVARRARNKKWDDVQKLAGRTVEVNGAKARAFLPAPVGEADHSVNKLQISGTDLPIEKEELPEVTATVLRPEIFIDAGLGMTVGKAAAQVGHGAMLYAAFLNADEAVEWYKQGCPVVVREVPSEQFTALSRQLERVQKDHDSAVTTQWINAVGGTVPGVLVRDAGYTEIAPGSATVIALGGDLGA